MKITYLKQSLVSGWWLLATILVFALLWSVRSATAESTVRATGERLITVYDRGQEQNIVTRATTVRDALKEAEIDVNDIDIVEPKLDAKLTASHYSVNVYRARPVVVSDGISSTRVMTAAQSPTAIAKAAKTALYDEDQTKLNRVDDVLSDGGAGLKMSIDRATAFTFVQYGKSFTTRTQATTVGAMLKEKGIELGPDDGTSLSFETPITANMTVALWRNGVQTITQEEAVAMPVRQVKDTEKEIGYKAVQTTGKPGKKQVTYEINTQNGKEVARKEIQSVVTEQPTEQVEVIGAKTKAITGSCGEWMAAAGVPNSTSANYLIAKESGCNPNSVNKSSGACGIGQSLPCSKMGPVNADGTSAVDPVGQMRWMHNYVMGRYGSWDAAAAFHRSHGWY